MNYSTPQSGVVNRHTLRPFQIFFGKMHRKLVTMLASGEVTGKRKAGWGNNTIRPFENCESEKLH